MIPLPRLEFLANPSGITRRKCANNKILLVVVFGKLSAFVKKYMSHPYSCLKFLQ